MKDAIAAVIGGIMDGFNQESSEAYQIAADSDLYCELAQRIEERTPDRFSMNLNVEHMRAVDGLLLAKLGDNPKAKFLFRHGDFIESHVRKAIERTEGFSCGADKTRTVMRSLARYLVDGIAIDHDYSGERTYHLPTKVLSNQVEVLSYFNGLHRLYYGDPMPYLSHLVAYPHASGT
ncbi:hypothetical protein QO021_29075 (plasmid) [Pseudomonas amygdali pv. lachrymans]|uniref:Uncharacterized protein n=1 Tax=Pseudomonas syringae pv. maculicola str. ES4326 TaxID=629265 RepID=A0A8T8CAJ4_PSEYM|nr:MULTISPECIES: hypothetical protein [Pseudomonas syringae group]QHF00656.1 hypothetical protein PMA4326_029610 [Pseudomonas syringae pv. maculicola str. ES4326]RMM39154.1 hypothetical protein ALQ79_200041 [Pseudomonas amygdali pv. lachrymans]UBZ00653.1 hypothetical protein LCG56_28240 [Pseudomonas cannabina pv. alisalensis]WIO61613.1 hypothetical protein QO021_29075 [Pseudomonas amygdali pv. lachrymans]